MNGDSLQAEIERMRGALERMARLRVRRYRGGPAQPATDPRRARALEALDEARTVLLEGDEDRAIDAAARAAFTLREGKRW